MVGKNMTYNRGKWRDVGVAAKNPVKQIKPDEDEVEEDMVYKIKMYEILYLRLEIGRSLAVKGFVKGSPVMVACFTI